MEQNQSTRICRTCLTENGEFQSIFVPDETTGSHIHLAEMIMSYASVQITLGDGLSEEICTTCARQVSNFYVFKQQCEESDTALRNRFGISPYNVQEEQKIPTVSLFTEPDCMNVVIKSEFGTEQKYRPNCTENDQIKKSHTCEICSVSFTNFEFLKEHKKIHIDEEDVVKTFDKIDSNVVEINPETILQNEEDVKPVDELSAGNEIEEIVITDSTNIHFFNETTDSNEFTCKVCGYLGDDEDDLKKHHCLIKDNNLECTVCNRKFNKVSLLTRHLKIHSAIKPHMCVLCGKGFARVEQLNNHMNMHSGVKPHVCKICAKGFNQMSNLKDHMRTHNGEKPFLCSTCGKGFNQLGNLRQHTIRHSGIKAHLCSICGNGFASKGELCTHLRKHTGARPFVCSVCNHGFTTSSSLTKHKRIHSGEKPYECEVCKMRFSRSGILARHKRTHTGEKPYVCKYCTKAFSQTNDLSTHLRIHTGEKPYICDTCGQAFRQSSALRNHKKTHRDKITSIDSKVISMVHTAIFDSLQ